MADKKSARKPPLKIAGRRIKRGETHDLRLHFSESYTGLSISVPLRVIAAPKRGPVVFMTALVHGDELNGLGILRELLLEQPLNLTRGTVIAVPAVNVYGLETHSRYLPDRRDLNRSFPGTSSGSLSSRLARTIFEEIISKCDYGIDFHTAAQGRTNFPNVRGDLSNPDVRNLARAFGAGLIVDGEGPEGSLRAEAVRAGVPTIILEAGEIWKIEPGLVELGVRGATNVLKRLNMMDGDPADPPFQSLIRRSVWVRADRGGVLKYHVAPGDVVKQDQLLAVNLDIFGGEQNRLMSPVDGVILGMSTMPLAKPGDAIFHVGVAPEAIGRLEKRMSRPKGQALHHQIRENLATNILVKEPDEGEPADSGTTSAG